jgi:predicted enzyme related to lactoylglutathione lyase
MPRVVHFEIAADDPERAVAFYREVFGWEIEKWAEGEYWLCTTGPDEQMGINGAIMRRSDPSQMVVNTIGVDSLEEALAMVVDRGGKVLTDVMEIPGIGNFAYCQDTEGNPFGVLQPVMA